MRMLAWTAIAVVACTGPKDTMHATTTPEPSPLAADAVAGIDDPALRAVVAEHWELMMRWTPTWATTLGDHRYDDQLAPRDAAAIARYQHERDELRARVHRVDGAKLGETDRVTLALLAGRLDAEAGLDVCKFHEWLVDSGGSSVLGELSYLVESHLVKTPRDAHNLIARMHQGAKLVDDTIANLAVGLADGRVSSKEKVRRAIEQLSVELDKPTAEWAMANPSWAKAQPSLAAELGTVVDLEIRPALARQREFLVSKVLPKARGENEGLAALPDGDACYRATIVNHVGLAMSPQELHALGLAEIGKTDARLVELGGRVLGTRDLASTIAKLRDDHSLYFESREQILDAAQHALARAKAAIPAYFSVLPKADCVMREIPDYEAPYSTIAYYRQPHYDGSKPGEYFVNTYKPETRPRFELEALTWHESIPG
ncbi:MAG TPA: DUF885 domain-containing protein, partial [Kofleriaceae bacterium]|nr:DUF885 domain-containing protein [Kofleriaceae bacterium]